MGSIYDYNTKESTPGSMILQGSWDASLNSPNISGTTTVGFSWIVTVAGTTNLGGISSWAVNDQAVKTSSGWAKVVGSVAPTTWGSIQGTLSSQTDLQATFDARELKLVASTLWYVDKNRIDGYIEDGTINRPYKTLQGALNALPGPGYTLGFGPRNIY